MELLKNLPVDQITGALPEGNPLEPVMELLKNLPVDQVTGALPAGNPLEPVMELLKNLPVDQVAGGLPAGNPLEPVMELLENLPVDQVTGGLPAGNPLGPIMDLLKNLPVDQVTDLAANLPVKDAAVKQDQMPPLPDIMALLKKVLGALSGGAGGSPLNGVTSALGGGALSGVLGDEAAVSQDQLPELPAGLGDLVQKILGLLGGGAGSPLPGLLGGLGDAESAH